MATPPRRNSRRAIRRACAWTSLIECATCSRQDGCATTSPRSSSLRWSSPRPTDSRPSGCSSAVDHEAALAMLDHLLARSSAKVDRSRRAAINFHVEVSYPPRAYRSCPHSPRRSSSWPCLKHQSPSVPSSGTRSPRRSSRHGRGSLDKLAAIGLRTRRLRLRPPSASILAASGRRRIVLCRQGTRRCSP